MMKTPSGDGSAAKDPGSSVVYWRTNVLAPRMTTPAPWIGRPSQFQEKRRYSQEYVA